MTDHEWNIDEKQMEARRTIGAILSLRVRPRFHRFPEIVFCATVENAVLTTLHSADDCLTMDVAMADADRAARAILIAALDLVPA